MTGPVAGLAATVAALLLTYALHSTVFFGGAWLLGRFVLRREAWRDVAWKAALVGAFLTTVVSGVPGRYWAPTVTAPFAAAPEALVFAPTAPSLPRPTDAVDLGVPAFDPTPAEAFGAPPARFGLAPSGLEPLVEESRGWRLGAVLEAVANTGASTILAVWGFLALALLTRVGWRRLRLYRALRDRQLVHSGPATRMLDQLRLAAAFDRPVRLTSTEVMATPLALGRAEICVPAPFFERLSEEEQRVAFAHELAHLVRRDPLWHLAAQLLGAVFFFQPLQLVATKKLRESAELLADAWAVRETGARLGLARCLVEVANWISSASRPEPAGSIAMAEAGSPLMNRVRRLLDGELETVTTSPAARFAAVAVVAVAAGLAPAVVAHEPTLVATYLEGVPRLEVRVDEPPTAVAQTVASASPTAARAVAVEPDQPDVDVGRAVDVSPAVDLATVVDAGTDARTESSEASATSEPFGEPSAPVSAETVVLADRSTDSGHAPEPLTIVAATPDPAGPIANDLMASPLLSLEPAIVEVEAPVVLMTAVERAAPPIRLDEIVVTAGRIATSERLEDVGFYRRRQQGIGKFFDRRAVEGLPSGAFDELFVATAGMHRRCDGLRCGFHTSRGFAGFRDTVEGCEMQTFVDGSPFAASYDVSGDWVEAVEVYTGPSQLPPQFHGPDGGACGAVVVWTRF